jgi:hypothetical protein
MGGLPGWERGSCRPLLLRLPASGWLVSLALMCTSHLPAYCSKISRSFLVVFLSRSESNSADPVFIACCDGRNSSENRTNQFHARFCAQGPLDAPWTSAQA